MASFRRLPTSMVLVSMILLISNAQLQEFKALRKISASVQRMNLSRTIGLESIKHGLHAIGGFGP
ncbi:hypothetical protein [Desulfosporosinus sp. BICA1-9]|uniref:hypothetical protein n=1 Tax=Desulfosporosinus sp. BICA1-9 TaxID=1531958 RepID=UPI00054BF41A|nr:hypothetical protein [Desulfosporosinus sp. BICA1-9]KJS83683.1 MAG: hypothetical protein JL57_22385 [Desulfosporosinus sp. BICA1-9]